MAKSIFKTSKQWLENNMDFRNLLQSRVILYFFFLVSLVNLYTFVSTGDGLYAAIFILVGYLTTFFSKNMIVILCLALVISNVLKYGSDVRVRDGFTADTSEDDVAKPEPAAKVDTKPLVKSEPEPATKVDAKPLTKPDTKPLSKPDTNANLDKLATLSDDKDTSGMKDKINKTIKSMDDKSMDPVQKENIKGLLELQSKIMTGVSNLAPLLKEAQAAMEQIKGGNFAL